MKSLGIRTKIVLIVVLISLVDIGATIAAMSRIFSEEYAAALQSRSVAIAKSLAVEVERPLQLGISLPDLLGFDDQCLETVQNFSGIAYAMIVGNDGVILFHNDPRQIGRVLGSGRLLDAVREGAETVVAEEGTYAVAVPAHAPGERVVGAAIVGFPTAAVDTRAGDMAQVAWAIGLFILFLGTFVLLTTLSVSVIRPIGRLIRTIRDLRDEGVSLNGRRATIETGDEIGQLGLAFNRLLDRIAGQEEALREINTELERRVEQRTAELQMAASVFENTAEGVMIADAKQIIVDTNPAFTEITLFPREEIVGMPFEYLLSNADDQSFLYGFHRELASRGWWQGEVWSRRRNGEAHLLWLTVNRIAEAGREETFVGVFHDVTKLRSSDQRIRFLAFHDALTELPNRTLFEERLRQSLEYAQRERGPLALVFADLDGFKQVNDIYGHDLGDKLLKLIGRRLQRRLRRGTDTVARLGGDEFVMLLENCSPSQCETIAQGIIADVGLPAMIAGESLQVGVSLGVAIYPRDADNADELLKNADAAMYEAKASGKNCVRFFRPSYCRLEPPRASKS